MSFGRPRNRPPRCSSGLESARPRIAVGENRGYQSWMARAHSIIRACSAVAAVIIKLGFIAPIANLGTRAPSLGGHSRCGATQWARRDVEWMPGSVGSPIRCDLRRRGRDMNRISLRQRRDTDQLCHNPAIFIECQTETPVRHGSPELLRHEIVKSLKYLVGAGGFEIPTPNPPVPQSEGT